MEYVIVLYGDGHKRVIGTCFFTGYIEDAYNKGELLLAKHHNARHYNVFERDFYFNILKHLKRTEK